MTRIRRLSLSGLALVGALVGALGCLVAVPTAASAAATTRTVGAGTAFVRSQPSVAPDPAEANVVSIGYSEEPEFGQVFRPRVSTSFDRGQTWAINTTLPVPGGRFFLGNAAVGALGGGRLVAGYLVVGSYDVDGVSRDLISVVVTRSIDAGKTWSSPEYVYRARATSTGACTAVDATRSTSVDLATDVRGVTRRAYFAWLSDDSCVGGGSRYHLVRTANDGASWTYGATWSPYTNGVSDATELQLFSPHLTVTHSGVVLAGYSGVFSGTGPCGPALTGAFSVDALATSTDAGSTVRSTLISSACNGFTIPRLAVNPVTKTILATIENGTQIQVLRSVDDGAHWSFVRSASTFTAMRSAAITATPDGHIAIVGVITKICTPELVRSTDDGATWSAPSVLTTTIALGCPLNATTGVGVTSDGTLRAAWSQLKGMNGRTTLFTTQRNA
jgi:hypothetical protein